MSDWPECVEEPSSEDVVLRYSELLQLGKPPVARLETDAFHVENLCIRATPTFRASSSGETLLVLDSQWRFSPRYGLLAIGECLYVHRCAWIIAFASMLQS